MDMLFKVWDSEQNLWIHEIGADVYLVDNGKVLVGDYYDEGIVEIKELVLVNNTGVTDNKGDFIYDGDIIQYDSPSKKHQYKHLITYEDGSYEYWKSEGMIFCQANMKYKRGMKIIGNRFENPELLDQLTI